LCGMVRQSDQEGALLLSNVSRPSNRRIRAPNQQLHTKRRRKNLTKRT
jgi:hypothetical protein